MKRDGVWNWCLVYGFTRQQKNTVKQVHLLRNRGLWTVGSSGHSFHLDLSKTSNSLCEGKTATRGEMYSVLSRAGFTKGMFSENEKTPYKRCFSTEACLHPLIRRFRRLESS